MALQIRRLVGDYRIADRVCLVKRIVGKIDNLVVNGLGNRLRNVFMNTAGNPLLRIAVYKNLPFRFDDLHLLFGNRTANIVCLSHRIATQTAENLNNLLLIDNTAIGDLQNRLQKRGLISNLPAVQLVGNEFGNGIHWAGSVQRHDCGHIFNRGRTHINAHAGNACRFQLENALGLAFCQHFKGFRVVIRHLVDIEIGMLAANLLLCILDHRQVTKTQKVHF